MGKSKDFESKVRRHRKKEHTCRYNNAFVVALVMRMRVDSIGFKSYPRAHRLESISMMDLVCVRDVMN